MVGHSPASDAQKQSVKTMIEKMKDPTDKPDNMSFTMGWDVIASYSESQINKLLADRYGKEGSGVLQELSFDATAWDEVNDEEYTVNYNVKFGPPLLQFDPKAMSRPECSLTMPMISGTRTIGKKIKDMENGWRIKLNNIPLATAQGKLSDSGKIEGDPPLIPGTEAVAFNLHEVQQQHVVLGFEMDKSKLVVEAIPPPEMKMNKQSHAFMQESFQKRFKAYFAGESGEENESGKPPTTTKPKPMPRSLSYSIASVNNQPNGEAVDLTPEKFQFVTYYGDGANKDVRLISIFIQVRGGSKKAKTEALQEQWKTQWLKNGILPVPREFTASLILSADLLTGVILKQGFAKSKWDVVNQSGNETLIRLDCKSQEKWQIPEQNHNWGSDNIFHVDGFEFKLSDHPMKITIQQEECDQAPTVYAFWEMEKKVHWENTYKLFGKRVTGKQGWVTPKYRLCHDKDYSKPRKLDGEKGAKFEVDDEKFEIDLGLDPSKFRMDQDEQNGLPGEYDTWKKGMSGLWTQVPKVKVSTFGIHFLRTTNLLMPGQHVIDINETIGVRIPKDLILVGDVEKEKK